MTQTQAKARASVLLGRTDLLIRKMGPVMDRYGGRYSVSIPLGTAGGIPFSRTVASGHSWQSMIDRLESIMQEQKEVRL